MYDQHSTEPTIFYSFNFFKTLFKELLSTPIFIYYRITSFQPQEQHKDCPLDKDELGRSTWGFLHTMASYYPEKPTTTQLQNMTKFFNIFAEFYPCEPCALDFKEE